jgi:serine/threonine-protein kinase
MAVDSSSFDPTDRGRMVAGKYVLLEPVGEGGMAIVWRAEMRMAAGFSRTVALKKMKPELRAGQNYVAMFIEEARVGAELAHPNIVQVLDFCEDRDGLYCLVMEWIDGIDLRAFLRAIWRRGTKLPWQLAAGVGVGTLRGLAAAHERRTAGGQIAPVVHRDVTPSNILLGGNGVVKLGDFGLARARDRMQSLTAPGIIKGKLAYIAPEIARGDPASIQSDVFAVGCVMWEALAGQPLFDGKTDLDVFRRVRAGQILPLFTKRDDLPPRLIEVVHQALAPSTADRYRSAREMAQDLATVVAGEPLTGDAQELLGQAVTEVRDWLAADAAGVSSPLSHASTPIAGAGPPDRVTNELTAGGGSKAEG